ncbi:MAG TPA: hypothetical protein VIR29_04405 [Anseongella sp.]
MGGFFNLPAAFFPRDTEEEKRMFGLLTRSFSAFRYRENYRIRAEEAVKLLERVGQFLEGIDKWCRGKLAELQRLAAAAEMDVHRNARKKGEGMNWYINEGKFQPDVR